jgi:CHASE1-domain containing sensor protein/CheY-like chemotaxis protein
LIKNKTHRVLIAILLYVGICLLASILIKPFSILSFIGPAAGLAGALMILWGTYIAIAIVIGHIFFSVLLVMYFDVEVANIGIAIIILLAVLLQGLWSKHITHQEVNKQEWLDSRILAATFIIKIGPFASLIAAGAAVLVAILHVKQVSGGLFYVFISTWSASIIVAIFLTPVLLFTQGKLQLNFSKRIFVVVSSVLGCLAISLLIKTSQHQQVHQRFERFEQTGNEIQRYVDKEITKVSQKLNAMSALFLASEHVSASEFKEFSKRIFNNSSNIRALEWIPVVAGDKKDLYESDSSIDLEMDYRITEQTVLGNTVLAKHRLFYMPVKYIYPKESNEMAFGLDLYLDQEKKKAITLSVAKNVMIATPPIALVQDNFSNPGVIVFFPINTSHKRKPYGYIVGNNNTRVTGFIAVVVQFKTLFRVIDEYQESHEINVLIQDVDSTGYLSLFGDKPQKGDRLVDELDISVFSRTWRFTITERNAWALEGKNWQTWSMLIGSTVGGLLFQLLVLMMAAYSTELSRQVTLKTRELILAKEKSDQENQAKTDFLKALCLELRSPLNVIKRLAEIFPEKNLPEKARAYLTNISEASLNLEQLVDTVTELSSIESGERLLNEQRFDFYLFLNRMESMLKVNPNIQDKEIKLVVNANVPQFINTDELRLQQMFLALIENIFEILSCKGVLISFKSHFHQHNNVTILFVITPIDINESFAPAEKKDIKIGELNVHNTRMTMVKDLCHMFGGDIKVSHLPSGDKILSLSINILLSDNEGKILIDNKASNVIEEISLPIKRILLIEDSLAAGQSLCQQLLGLNYQVEVIDKKEEVIPSLDNQTYHMIIYDGYNARNGTFRINLEVKRKKEYYHIPIIGVFEEIVDDEETLLVKEGLTAMLIKPIELTSLNLFLLKYLT